jgi:hypothetical protein
LARHHRRFHKRKRSVVDVEVPITFGDDHDASDAFDGGEVSSCSIPNEAFLVFHGHSPTKRFFDDLQIRSFLTAAQNMVARSCFLDSRICNEANSGIAVKDLILFLRVARLVFQLGPKHQHLLGGVLSGFETRFPPPNVDSFYRSGHVLQLPTTYKAFVAKLLNQTNTNSLTSIIPIPPTTSLSGKHAYVSIPALLAYDLGLANANVDPPYNAKFQRLVNSEHGQTLFLRAKLKLMAEGTTLDAARSSFVPLVVMFMMWFDGWEP